MGRNCFLWFSKKGDVYINFTNKLWKFVVWFGHSTAVTNIVYISLSISELQEHASSHCSLLWYTKALFTNKIIIRLVLNH